MRRRTARLARRFNAVRNWYDRPTPLPEVPISHGAVVAARVVRILAALLPALMAGLLAFRMATAPNAAVSGSHIEFSALTGAGLAITLSVISAILAAWVLLRPTPVPALIAIGVAALVGLAQPPSLPWALAFTILGYLAYRCGLLANQIPWDAKISTTLLTRLALRDLVVLGITVFAGIAAWSLYSNQVANPIFAVLGAIALLALILGISEISKSKSASGGS